MTPFKEDYRITQLFGKNPEWYKPYGFNGHEGLDLVPKSGSWDILSMEDGVVVRDVDFSRDNYGIYCVIWNKEKKRAFWYCHMASNDTAIGAKIEKGQKIGVMGKTGKVTGAHLHLGLRESDANGTAINLDNSYKGFIDPLPLVRELNIPQSKELTACLKAFTDVRTQLDKKGEVVIKLKEKISSATILRKKMVDEASQLRAEHTKLVKREKEWQVQLETASEQYLLLDENFQKVSTERTQYRTYYDRNNKKTGIGLIVEGIKKIFEHKK